MEFEDQDSEAEEQILLEKLLRSLAIENLVRAQGERKEF